MQHSTRSLFSLLSLAVAAFSLSACPGRITDPSPFIGGGGEGGMAGCSIASTQIESQLIQPRCATAGCHDRASRMGSLDLQSPNIGARLIGQPSTCMGRPLVDPANRGASYFIAKVAEAAPGCGARMPLGAPAFTASEISCVRSWVASLSTVEPMPDAGMDVVAPRPDAAADAPISMPDVAVMPDVAGPDTGMGMDVVAPMDARPDVPASMPDAAPADTGTPPMDSGVALDASADDAG